MINLFYNYYKDKNEERQKEIDLCFSNNIKNSNLNVITFNSQNRLTFSFFFKKINLLSSTEDINIICNSDIFFDESISLCSKIKENQVFALSRWDVGADNIARHYDHSDSQDVWILKGKVKSNVFGEFCLGIPGCDNRIAYEFQKAGYVVLNPSKTLKSFHLHNSGIRNYVHNQKNAVPGPYLRLNCSELR